MLNFICSQQQNIQEQRTELFVVGFGSDKMHYYSKLQVALPVKVMSGVSLQLSVSFMQMTF